VPIKDAALHPSDGVGEDRTARSLPDVDTPSSGTGIGEDLEPAVRRFRAQTMRAPLRPTSQKTRDDGVRDDVDLNDDDSDDDDDGDKA
jgi:hypothetical protein